jgi:hypothetical protein
MDVRRGMIAATPQADGQPRILTVDEPHIMALLAVGTVFGIDVVEGEIVHLHFVEIPEQCHGDFL